ncbi:MAG: FeoB-associated Cys-rich membrane protein [Bacteroidales bacterium]|nr:FeoB-associated Cys-rich membrane protein [Bacteroidales bacterium]
MVQTIIVAIIVSAAVIAAGWRIVKRYRHRKDPGCGCGCSGCGGGSCEGCRYQQ